MTEETMSDSQSNKSLPSFSSSSCEESNNPTGKVSAKISIPSPANTVTVNGTVVTASGDGGVNEDGGGSGEVLQSCDARNDPQIKVACVQPIKGPFLIRSSLRRSSRVYFTISTF